VEGRREEGKKGVMEGSLGLGDEKDSDFDMTRKREKRREGEKEIEDKEEAVEEEETTETMLKAQRRDEN